MRRCAPVELRAVRGAGSPVVFDLNDFDETLPAPFEWDVKRLVASVVVAARDNGHRRKEQRTAARAAAAAYRTTMAKAARMRFLDVWYTRFDADKLLADLAPQSGQGRDQVRAEGPCEGADADEPGLAGEVRASGSTAATGSSSSRR